MVRRRIFYLAVGQVLSRSQAAVVPNGAISRFLAASTFCCAPRTRLLLFAIARPQLNRNYPHWKLPLRQIETAVSGDKKNGLRNLQVLLRQ
jgi:hypothetical protein